MKINKNNKGFFVWEAVVAILLFSIGILSVLKVQTEMVQATTDAQYRISASYLAESIIGQIILDQAHLDDYIAGTGTEYTNWLGRVEALTKSNSAVVATAPTITKTIVGGIPKITVTIYWKSPSSGVESQYITTASLL
jgi:type IV pilus assembly protein PilV